MTILAPGRTLRLAAGRGAPAAPVRPVFAWLVTAAHAWILTGLFVDGYFHLHDPHLETFFTPWHALLYSGIAATVALTAYEVRRAGRVPVGFAPAVVGGALVTFAGLTDLTWHTVLGIEADLAALLSPPHLLLITAGTLVFAAPLRAALRTRDARLDLPAALSVAAVLAGLMFFTQYANPFGQLFPVRAPGMTRPVLELREVAGVAGVVLTAALVGGAAALLRARTSLPAGALLAAVAVSPLAMTALRGTWLLVPGIVLAGLAVEAVGRRLPAVLLGALAPAILITAWALTLVATRDVAWNVELLSGSVCSAAAAGSLTGWLAVR